ncbi:ABC transporter substrate-binding protein [Methanothrix sp.]|uniref:ABC transporter substrate-binding protein n=1 Tax=Methanothrix sp. TaxID=90426 RepID=UPI003BB60EC4
MNGKLLGGALLALILFCLFGACEGEEIGDNVSIVDGTGKLVNISLPVERIVSITSRASEIISALGSEDRIVGRDSYSFFPSSLKDVPVVAESSYTPNIELIHKIDPDLVIADSMLSEDDRKKIESAGIPVIIETTWDSTTVATPVRHIGALLDREDRAEEIIGFIERYQGIIEERTAGLEEKDKPAVFFEWSRPYYSMGNGTLFHNLTVAAGGINIVADEPVKYPTMDPEWLVERDPDIIIRYDYSTEKENLTANMVKTRDEILSRPELSDVKAIKDEWVYILGNPVASGVRSVVGDLYLAKWFHPDLFKDIDPEAVHRELLQKFFGQEPDGVYVYP